MNEEIIIKRKKNPFVQIDNSVFNDDRLSFKAKGILGYLLSKPKIWIPRIKDLYNKSTDGYDSIRSGVSELLLTGYLELRTNYTPENEFFHGKKYWLYEEPLFKNGWRNLENKNKNFKEDEEILSENPLKNKRGFK